MIRSIIAILAPLLAACSGERIQGAPQPGETIDLPPMQWRVVDRQTLRARYVEYGMSLDRGDRLSGFVGTTADGRVVIYSLPPVHVDDHATMTIGHEVLHVAVGDYHR